MTQLAHWVQCSFNLRNHQRAVLVAIAFLFPFGGATFILPWALVVKIVQTLRERRLSWIRSAIDLPLAVFLALALLAGLFSGLPTVALGSWMLMLLAFGVVFQMGLAVLQQAPQFVRSLHRTFALGTLAAAGYGLLLLDLQHPDRAQMLIIGPNAYGFGLMAGIFLTLPLLRNAYLWAGAASVTVIVTIAAIIATFSRAALYGLVAGSLSYFWLERRVLSFRRVVVIAASMALGLLIVLTTPLILRPLATQLTSHASYHGPVQATVMVRKALEFLFSKEGNGDRFFIWRGAVAVIRSHPWLGVGLGVFPFVVYQWDRQLPPGMPPHSLYLNMAAEVGVPGALAFMAILARALWFALRRQDPYRNAVIASMAGMLAAEVRDNILLGFHMALGFIVILAMLIAPCVPNQVAMKNNGLNELYR